MKKKLHMETQLCGGWKRPHPSTTPLLPAMYQSNSYAYKTLDEFMEAGAQEMLESKGFYFYTRTGNPTNAMFEHKIADLEGGEKAVAFASGMAAIATSLLCFLKSGDRVITHNKIYGATDIFFEEQLPEFGIDVEWADLTDLSQLEKALSKPANLLFIECPANPLVEIIDIPAAAKMAHEKGLTVIVDNSWASPYVMRPLDFGADLVASSASKYVGHNEAMGGYVTGKSELVAQVDNYMLTNGGVMAPFNALLTIIGIKTLHVRMDRHAQNAMEIAKFLEGHSKVQKIHYPGLKSHPQHKIAKRLMSNYSGMICFWLKGGFESAQRFMNNLKVCLLAVSLADVCTLVEHPATMTHITTPEEKREQLGITDNLIRLSVGLENVSDIVRDIDRALMKS